MWYTVGVFGWVLAERHLWGQLLAATAIDPNDCILPVAWAVVRTESTETWT